MLEFIKYKFRQTKKKLFVFTSFNGSYSDGPLYLSNYLSSAFPEYKIVWLVNHPEKYNENNISFIQYNKKNLLYYRSIAHVIIDNVDAGNYYILKKGEYLKNLKKRISIFLKRKRNQFVYTTWHGVPLKKMGRDQYNSIENACIANKMTMITNCQFENNIMSFLTFGKLKMKVLGSPRNDILYSDNGLIKSSLGISNDKKIVLYAPTFRNEKELTSAIAVNRSGIDQLNELKLDSLLEELKRKFNKEFVLICRFHYHVEKMIDWSSLQKKYGQTLLNGNKYEDMAKYLACSDILITDASSSMFDFMLTYKPCFLFFPDIQFYKNEERGFYFDVNELPFSVSINTEELIDNIKSFNLEDYTYKVKRFIERMGIVDDGNSSKRIIDYIIGELNDKTNK